MNKTFQDLGIAPAFIKALDQQGITTPTPIQEEVIPFILNNTNDVVALAKTGTGKTAAYGLPILQKIQSEKLVVQALILVPTRELGQQVTDELTKFSSELPAISIVSTCGGVPIKPQINRLKEGAHVVVATPGRLIDLLQRKAIVLTEVDFVVLDEADEMINILNEGLKIIYEHLPKQRRALLFTATLTGAVKQLVQNYLSKGSKQIEVAM
ncbi:MAG: DEAD/DEAH box helicase, partial [Flavobacteriaceae bacterium]|nr:DEAD/DEAH box helicase [Flavobacteriaceae bacterium]